MKISICPHCECLSFEEYETESTCNKCGCVRYKDAPSTALEAESIVEAEKKRITEEVKLKGLDKDSYVRVDSPQDAKIAKKRRDWAEWVATNRAYYNAYKRARWAQRKKEREELKQKQALV